MKKRNAAIAAASAAVVIALVIFVQPVQSFAANVLSALRVQDMRAIHISLADIDQFAQGMQAVMPADQAESDQQSMESAMPGEGNASPQPVDISSARQFGAFDFLLPRSLDTETPHLQMIESQTRTVTLDTVKINGELTKIGAQPLPDSLDGSRLMVQSPATAIANYADNTLIETQMPVLSGDSGVIDSVKQSVLSLPMLSESLRSQLAAIDITSGDMYVPVIEGFGQQTMVGNSTAYLYTLTDLKALLNTLPDSLTQASGKGQNMADKVDNFDGDASALVWVNNGVLYVLIGNQAAGDLTQIANSIK